MMDPRGTREERSAAARGRAEALARQVLADAPAAGVVRRLAGRAVCPLPAAPVWYVILVGLLTAEWLLRKRGGLA